MSASNVEHFFVCPHCWQRISMLLDLSAGTQRYVEDCEVCCNPIEVRFSSDGDVLTGFDAQSLEQ